MRELWINRGFLPFVAVLVMNAMTDIAHKITIQNLLIKSYEGDTLIILSALVNALILIPFVLLFSPSGFISDRFKKSHVVRYSAAAGVVLALLATASYYLGWFYIAFALTFLLAAQSAIYSPAKYGLIKEIAGTERIAYANGIVQAATIVAILGSALLFSVLFESLYDGSDTPSQILKSVAPIGWMLVAMTLLELYFAFKIPQSSVNDAEKRFDAKEYFQLNYLRRNLSLIREDRSIWLSIIGLSMFWGISQLVVAAFPAHYKSVTSDENTVVIQGILAASAIGLMMGSFAAGRISRRRIELGIVPLGALGMFLSLIYFSSTASPAAMAIASLLFGVSGGLLIVPLNSLIQYLAPPKRIGTILAGNNFIQNVTMILFLVATILLVQTGFSSYGIFNTAALITLIGSLYAFSEIAQLAARVVLIPILKTRYRLFVEGLENLPQRGGVLLLGNHISWIDWLILQVASPRPLKFVMERSIYEQWYLKWFLKRFDVIPISGVASKGALEAVRERLLKGEAVALFPEGRISYNGQLGEFKKGFELILKDVDVPVVPFYLHGLWGSTFSRACSGYKLITRSGPRREVGVVFGRPLKSNADRVAVKQAVQSLSFKAWDRSVSSMKPLHFHWLRRCKEAPFKRALADDTGSDMNRLKMLTSVLLFSKLLKNSLGKSRNIGVLLPSSAAGAIANMTLLAMGKRVVNLNYTIDPKALKYAMQKADIEYVVTSERFLKRLEKRGFNPLEGESGVKPILMEELAKQIRPVQKALTLAAALLLPKALLEALYFEKCRLNDTAAILFSSGSEGVPKGIELTHKNLLGNIKQVSAMLNFCDEDVILNSLPIFHSFGLTVTTLLPLCEGVEMVSVADPTDALAVGKSAARYRATIIFGTATFFRIYTKNRKLHPLMFSSVRMAVAGAEKLKPQIRKEFKAKFGIDLFEGYGTTETSPVVSVNMPDMLDPDTLKLIIGHKEGSVGQPLPGTLIKIVDPDSMKELKEGEDGLIMVAGVQVMKGYLDDFEKTKEVIYKDGGMRFYKTGDKGHLDEEGFLYIVDRYSRFAKIGGEMVSLGAVEEEIAKIFDEEFEAAAVAIADDKKGERIALLYCAELEPKEVKAAITASDIAPIMQPTDIVKVEAIPKLASGKADFKGAKLLVEKDIASM